MTGSTASGSGPAIGRRLMAPISRAIPARDRQSPRSGVTLTSNMVSSNSSTSETSAPGGTSGSSSMMPSWSSPTPSSRMERSMPSETVPRIFARRTLTPPPIRAPGRASAARIPARAFGAPQTTSTGSSSPKSATQSLSRSAFGCGRHSSTSATTTPAISPGATTGSAESTSSPARVSCSASSAVVTGGSTHSRSQRSLNLISPPA